MRHEARANSTLRMRKAGASLLLLSLLTAGCLAALAAAPSAAPHGPPRLVQLRQRALLERNGRYAGSQYQAALRARSLMLKRQAAFATPSVFPLAGTSSPAMSWTEIGPGNVGGRLNAISIDPTNANHLLVGAASGGLWQSNDNGSTWTAVGGFPGALTIGSIARLPNGTLLVGTGDVFTAGGDGMFSSSDGGASWTPIAATAPQSTGDFWTYINAIAVSSQGVALAATEIGIGRSTDGGQTWTKVLPPSNTASGSGRGSMDVAFDPNGPDDAVADDEAGGVEYSTDGGQTWQAGSGLPGSGDRVSIAFDPGVKGSVYALVNNNGDSTPSGQVYHSTDGGANWSLLAATTAFVSYDTGTADGALCDGSECQGSYDNVILVEPHASGTAPTIAVGGIDLFTSTDGGKTWSEIGGYGVSILHPDQHALAYSASGGTLYVGNDGGFYKQPSGSALQVDNEGLAVTQFYSATGHHGTTSSLNAPNGIPVTPIVAGAQDNGTLLYEGYSDGAAPLPDDWIPIFGGDGGMTQVDPADGNDVYGEYTYLQLAFSSSGGPGMRFYNGEPQIGNHTNFIAPYVLVPNGAAAATQILAGGAYLWLGSAIQSTNPTWTSISSAAMYGAQGYVSAIAVDPSNNNDVWVGYDGGAIWHSTDALGTSPTWTQTGASVLPSGDGVASLWIVPGQPDTIYATFDGYPVLGSGSNVWVTTDGGSTWTDVGSGLPPAPVYTLVTHPAYPQLLYAGTLTGVYSSTDGGRSWNASSLGPANVPVKQLTWFDTANSDSPTLLAATYGRGAWLGSPGYNPTPTLASISPAEVTAGAPDTLITLTGTGFVQDVTAVTLDGAPVAVTYQSATQLQASAPASVLAVGGTHTLVVNNPIPGGGRSAGANLSVINPVPILDSISPASAQVGSGAATLTVTGSAFVPGSTVEWDGNALSTTYDSATSLTASIPATDLVTAATVQITVVTGSPGGGASTAATFTVGNPLPVLSSISPASATAGAAALTLNVAGSNFVASSTVEWNGSALSTTYDSATSLTATIPATDLATGVAAQITVGTASPGGGTSTGATFTVDNPVPVLNSISPASATAGSAALTFTVTGSNFVRSSTVDWNGSTLSTTYISDTSLTAAVPSSDLAAAASAQVTVTTPHPAGGTSSATTFTVNSAPTSNAGGGDANGGGKGGGGSMDWVSLAILGVLLALRRAGRLSGSSAVALKFGDVFRQAALRKIFSCIWSLESSVFKSSRVNFHWKGRATAQ